MLRSHQVLIQLSGKDNSVDRSHDFVITFSRLNLSVHLFIRSFVRSFGWLYLPRTLKPVCPATTIVPVVETGRRRSDELDESCVSS